MHANNAATINRDALITADHPCLPGHFPDDPIVPGVVLLDCIGDMVRQWKPGCRITGVAQAKFHQLLRPEQLINITLSVHNMHSIKFECLRDREKIASGVITIEIPS